MTDDRLRALDEVTPPDLWDEITERADAGESVPLARVEDRRPRRLLLAAAIVLVVAGVAGGLVIARQGEDGGSTAAPALDPPGQVWGRQWELVRLTEDGAEVAIAVGGPPPVLDLARG